MNCLECNSNNSIFSELMGELVCEDCGFIIVKEMFEETVSPFENGEIVRSKDNNKIGGLSTHRFDNKETNLNRGISLATMLLTSTTKSYQKKDRLENLYLSCYRKGIFRTTSYEDRATALVYYILREDKLPYSIKELCKEYNSNPKAVYKLSKKIAQKMGNPDVFSSIPLHAYVEKYTNDMDIDFHRDCSVSADALEVKLNNLDENIRPTTHAALIRLVAKSTNFPITRKEIAEKTNFCGTTILREEKRILSILNEDSVEGRGLNWLL